MLWIRRFIFFRRFLGTIENLDSIIRNPRSYELFINNNFDASSAGGNHLIKNRIYLILRTINNLKNNSKFVLGCSFSRCENSNCPNIFIIAECFLQRENFRFDIEKFSIFLESHNQFDNLTLVELHYSLDVLSYICMEKLEHYVGDRLLGKDFSSGDALIKILVALEEIASQPIDVLLRKVCKVENLLEKDPAGYYGFMSVTSKRAYREKVHAIAKRDRVDAECIVKSALEACAAFNPTHIGHHFYCEKAKSISRFYNPISHLVKKFKLIDLYQLGIILFSIFFTFWLISCFVSSGYLAIFLIIPLLILSSDWLDNFFLAVLVPFLKRRELHTMSLEYTSARIEKPVIIAIPCIIDDIERVEKIFNVIRHNRNVVREHNVIFTLLSDWPDSDSFEVTFHERSLLDKVIQYSYELNADVDINTGKIVVLHRHRVYSESQKIWYGMERKTGKIQDLYNFVCTGECPFNELAGDHAALQAAEYVFVLDEDTMLSPGTILSGLASMLHPLNSPIISQGRKTIDSGYALVSPSLFVNPDSLDTNGIRNFLNTRPAFREHIQKAEMTCHRSPSFDAFEEIAFSGKGLYRSDYAKYLLAGKLPKEMVLSHDIVEGGILRTGYSNVGALIENFPPSYECFCARMLRWTRGDWQNFYLLLSSSQKQFSTSSFSRFLIATNVKKSLMPISVMFVVILGFLFPEDINIVLVFFVVVLGLSLEYLAFVSRVFDSLYKGTLLASIPKLCFHFCYLNCREICKLYLKPHYAVLSLYAISVAAWRFICGKRILEWHSSESSMKINLNFMVKPAGISLIASVLAVSMLYLGNSLFILVVAWIPFSYLLKKMY